MLQARHPCGITSVVHHSPFNLSQSSAHGEAWHTEAAALAPLPAAVAAAADDDVPEELAAEAAAAVTCTLCCTLTLSLNNPN